MQERDPHEVFVWAGAKLINQMRLHEGSECCMCDLLVEVVDEADPVKLDDIVPYTIRITNVEHESFHDVRVVCELPEGLSFDSAHGPAKFSREGNKIVFEPLAEVPARGSLKITLKARAMAVGMFRISTRISCAAVDALDDIIEQETTEVVDK